MVQKKVEPEKQVEPRQTVSPSPTTQAEVVKLFASILAEVQEQVQTKAPKPLQGKAVEAVNLFREIGAALALQALPTITLTALPPKVPFKGGSVELTWKSTDAETVFLEKAELGGGPQKVADLTPAAGGFIEFFVEQTTVFRATAKGPCGSATSLPVTVTVEMG